MLGRFFGDFRSKFKPGATHLGADYDVYTLGQVLPKDNFLDYFPKEPTAWDLLDKSYYQTFLYENPETRDLRVCLIYKGDLDGDTPQDEAKVLVITHPTEVFEASIKTIRYADEHRLLAPDGYSWKEEEGKIRISISQIVRAYKESLMCYCS
jgi:hypothetical protein